jgi:hypothetical protein
MRTALVYIVLLAIMLPTVSPLGTIAYFNLNRDYIARVLCENRDKPQLHCNGQCYLAKRLKAQQDKQNKETTERVQKLPVLQWFYSDPTHLAVASSGFDRSTNLMLAKYIFPVSVMFLPGVFQPPRA